MKNRWFFVFILLAYISVGRLFAQTPSTEGKDFWVTFLRADSYDDEDKSITLSLTFSTKKACSVTVTNPGNGQTQTFNVAANAVQKVDLYNGTAREDSYQRRNNPWDCYSNTSETVTSTALHVTATEDISLFAANYKHMSFDATNVLPTASLLDEYYVQTYPASVHSDTEQGSHFAIIAVEDNTTVDYELTTKTAGGKTGAQSVTLNKGEVYYVWSGKNSGDISDFSGTHVKARNHKPIAVFQGCPHTNLPDKVRDRDHIFSQAMPIAYWGNDFVITSSLHHRRDKIAVMAINDGTEVYINNRNGEPQWVHTFDFSKEPKHYWEFEIGQLNTYCTDDKTTFCGELKSPLVKDSACFLTTSCPAGVHMFMVSNRYDEDTIKHRSDAISDPAMLWISPVEQVINDITFSTFQIPLGEQQQLPCHYVNIVTLTANTASMTLTKNGTALPISFHPVTGAPDYSFARVNIENTANAPSNYRLTGDMGFLAHVYGYGQRESYAYSCGSSTVSRSIMLNGIPFSIDSVSNVHFCTTDTIDIQLNIGHNTYKKVTYDYGDGTSEVLTESVAHHRYENKGWYDLFVKATYVNSCTGLENSEDLSVSFYVNKPDTIHRETSECHPYDYSGELIQMDTTYYDCDSIVITGIHIRLESEPQSVDTIARDSLCLHGEWIYESGPKTYTLVNSVGCDSIVTYNVKILTCLVMSMPTDVNPECDGGTSVLIDFNKVKGDIASATFFKLDGTLETPFPMTISADGHSFVLDVSTFIPGTVAGRIEVYDEVCDETLKFPITIFVRLPNTILHQKYDNVVGVALDAIQLYGIQGYQWHLDGELKQGQSTSIYYQDNSFTSGQYIEVEVLLPNGKWIKSCRLNLTGAECMTNPFRQEGAEAQKVVRRGHIYILQEDGLYNTLGEKVE